MKKLLCLLALVATVGASRAQDPELYCEIGGTATWYSVPPSYINARLINTNESAFSNAGLMAAMPRISPGTLIRTQPSPQPAVGWVVSTDQNAQQSGALITVKTARRIASSTVKNGNGTISHHLKTQIDYDLIPTPRYRVQQWETNINGQESYLDYGWQLCGPYGREHWDFQGSYFTKRIETDPNVGGGTTTTYTAYQDVRYGLYAMTSTPVEVGVWFYGRQWPIYSDRNWSNSTDPTLYESKIVVARFQWIGADVTPKWGQNWDCSLGYGIGPGVIRCSVY